MQEETRIMRNRLSTLFRDQSGAAVIEYGFLAALGALTLVIVLGALAVSSVFASAAGHLAAMSIGVR